MWDLRAVALRCWVFAMMLAVCSTSLLEARPPSHQLRTSEPTAVWTWQMVNTIFFSKDARGPLPGTSN